MTAQIPSAHTDHVIAASLRPELLGSNSPGQGYTSPNQLSVTSPANIDYARAIEDVQFPPKTVCLHLATLYFDYVHDQLHTLFHKPTFMAEVTQDRMSSGLMLAVIALAAR